MHLGITPPYRAGVASDPEWMTALARSAEDAGFESISVVEHVVVPAGHAARYPYAEGGRMPLPDDCELPDPLDLLAFLAGRTERLVLSTGVLVAPHHHPLILAKRLATIDVLSGGRLRVGVGVGWMREELEATGVEFESRGRRLDETIDAMRAVWSMEEASFHGEFFRFDRAISRPRPVRMEGVPIHVGGHSPAAARRAGRRGNGFQPLGLDDALLADRMVELRRSAVAADRDPDAIELTLGGALARFDEEQLDAFRARGAHRIQLSATTTDLGELGEQLGRAAALVSA